MPEPAEIATSTKIKALICRICPLCIVARIRPDGGFARKLAEAEENCPFCRAYRQMHGDSTRT